MSSASDTTNTDATAAPATNGDTGAARTPARRSWSWARVILALLALPVGTWLLVRGLLAPVAGEGVSNATFGTVWGLLLVMLQPLALGFAMHGRAARLERLRPGSAREEALGIALYGVVWLAVFAVVATLTLAFFWRPTADGFAPAYPLVVLFFFAWGGLWLGVWLGLRYVRVPAAAGQALIGLGGIATSTSVLWLNPWLERIAESAARLEVMAWIVWTSPMYGWVELVLDSDLFRTGAMYHGAQGQAAYSIIGDYIGSIPTWPSPSEMFATWLLIGAAATALGVGVAVLNRHMPPRRRRHRRSET